MKNLISRFEYFRIKWVVKIKKRLFYSRDVVTQRINGYTMSFYNYASFRVLFGEVFLDNDYHFESNKSEPLIIDCGANIGMSILYFKMLYPNCHIVAFEPSPHAFKLLKENVERNNFQNVTLYNSALSSEEGNMTFYFSDDKGTLSSSLDPVRGGENNVDVKVEKLSSYIKGKEYDLVKMDVEGAEWGIVEDLIASKTITNSDNYLLEYHHRINGKHSSFSKFLTYFEEANFGFHAKAQIDNENDFQDIFLRIFKEKE